MNSIALLDIYEEELEEFPTKNKKRSSRRKNARFKGKSRMSRLYKCGCGPFTYSNVVLGILRNTNIFTPSYYKIDNCSYYKIDNNFPSTLANIKRKESSDNKLNEYFKEDI